MEPVNNAGGRLYACCLLQACDGSSPWLQFPVFCHSQNKAYHASCWQNLTGSRLSEENVGFSISTRAPQRRGVGLELSQELIASKASDCKRSCKFNKCRCFQSALTWNIFSSSGILHYLIVCWNFIWLLLVFIPFVLFLKKIIYLLLGCSGFC